MKALIISWVDDIDSIGCVEAFQKEKENGSHEKKNPVLKKGGKTPV